MSCDLEVASDNASCWGSFSNKQTNLYIYTVINICNLFNTTTARNKDNEDSKKETNDGKEQHKTALGRRASGVTPKMSKPGEQVTNCIIYV